MLQTKQSVFSTFQSRKNTQINSFNSRIFKDFKYDINEYLPADAQVRINSHLFSFARRDDTISITQRTFKAQDSQNQWISGYRDTINSLEETLKQRDKQMQKIVKLGDQKQKQYNQTIRKMKIQIDQLSRKTNKLLDQNEDYRAKLKLFDEALIKEKRQKSQMNQRLNEIRKQIQKKTKNIRIFCQKFQLQIPPKTSNYRKNLGQTYTIEVQTQKQRSKSQKLDLVDNQLVSVPSKQISMDEPPRKQIILKKHQTQFYQLYQQHNTQRYDNQNYELNNEITSRSQVIGSSNKPRRPFLDNQSEMIEKQNDKRKINQRIDGKSFKSGNLNTNKQKEKIKIKNQVIQICPVNQSDVELIVEGILNL